MYERFTDRARKVMQLANQEAQRLNHEYIGTEHILLGLVKEGAGVAANVLKNLDINLRKIREEIEDEVKEHFGEHQLKVELIQIMEDELNDLSGANKPVEVKLFGPDHKELRRLAEDVNGEKLEKNPLKDRRVRMALSLAINRSAIVDRVMEGAAVPSGQYLPPGVYSYTPDIKPPPYEPEQAKKLLAEAGYPKGFRIALHGPNDRYVNDAKIIQAVGQMWTRIGVQTEVDPLPWSSYVGPANKQAFSAFLFSSGTFTAEASDALIAQNATFDASKGRGSTNRGRYSNPALDKLIAFCTGHFEHEELSIAKYWAEGLEMHNAAHQSLMGSLRGLRSVLAGESGLNIREAVGNLIVKVNEHLERYDQRALERIALGGPEQNAAERFWAV